MHRVLSVGSLEVTDKAHQLKGVSLDALVASLIRFVAFLLSASTQEALMDATMQLYHGDADAYWDVPAMLADLDSEAVDEALWSATVVTTAGVAF